jgi:hypothetical protein
VYVAYFDEVKSDPTQGQDFYIVGGIVVPADKIAHLEREASNIAEELFGTRELVPSTEFHASYCYFAKAHFKGWAIENRLQALTRLLRLVSETDGVKRVYSAINTPKLASRYSPPETAFLHFVERVEKALPADCPCLLIGDLDDQQAKNMVRDFSRYRQHGTPSAYGIEIKSLVDSVHFCRSHHSRLLQLADVYVFHVAGLYGSRKGYSAERFKELKKEIDLFPSRYKVWP